MVIWFKQLFMYNQPWQSIHILNSWSLSSRAWRSSFVSVIYGQRRVLMPNVRASNAFLANLTAVASAYCLPNPILSTKNLHLKNLSHCVATFVIFIQNTIASSILLSSIGVQLNSHTGPAPKHLILLQWRRMSRLALTQCPFFGFKGKQTVDLLLWSYNSS